MDRPEIMANKGYESFAEHFVNEGIRKGVERERERYEAEKEALDAKRADFLRSKGVPEDVISEAMALK
jgi:hypothetical protein